MKKIISVINMLLDSTVTKFGNCPQRCENVSKIPNLIKFLGKLHAEAKQSTTGTVDNGERGKRNG